MVNHHMFHWTCYSISWKYPPFSDPYIISSSLWHLSHSANPCQPPSISHWIQCSMVISTMWNHIEYMFFHGEISIVHGQFSQCFFLNHHNYSPHHELPERAPFFFPWWKISIKSIQIPIFLGFSPCFPRFSDGFPMVLAGEVTKSPRGWSSFSCTSSTSARCCCCGLGTMQRRLVAGTNAGIIIWVLW